MNYIAFCDESYTSAERYRSIAVFSFKEKSLETISKSLLTLLIKSDVKEFKWQKLRTAKYFFCAKHFTNYLLDSLEKEKIRIDVLTWDTKDSRHQVQSRDDSANFSRMFFHLLKNVLNKREPSCRWKIYPDEKVDMDWNTLNDCLGAVGKWERDSQSSLFNLSNDKLNYNISEFEQKSSIDFPCIHVSDLFAGLSVLSFKLYEKYKLWFKIKEGQLDLFNPQIVEKFSNSEEWRFKYLEYFLKVTERKKLGVSFEANKRLQTFNPLNPINFWFYTPQHVNDKAPIRES
ncbi:MAG: hypothetical protein A2057_00940 [Ignavibacteria bacterium GWA2_35_9]|nr:MAG: hypothetical protein A2057_00940 [Ignavibacteria bacterium GWA2_35_9]OGU48081.1 MAG: hypothetical protein A2000_14510 [Ignavibacteria bacterium GWB2_36_8]OGU48528.1 MAG: hypothetical protein A2080_07920 [Ignavibacteria bacterium GWC2_36_12]